MGELIVFAGGFLMGALFGILVIGIVIGAKIDRGGEDEFFSHRGTDAD